MSGRSLTSVPVVVQQRGDGYRARAGTGLDAKIATSTSCAFSAARSAALKYFGPKTDVSFILVNLGSLSQTTDYLAKRDAKMVTIYFEDHGQDFIYWSIDQDTGQVVDCGPFQASTWCFSTVQHHRTLKIGDRPVIRPRAGHGMLTINYAIEKIVEGGVS